ncbi:MAG: response regulator transcription factor [Chitinophagales bacterium]
MEFFRGTYITTFYEAQTDRLVNHWAASPPSSAAFKKEMQSYVEMVLKVKPSQILWLQQDFNFEVDPDNRIWLQEGMRAVSKVLDTFPDGHHKMAFVIGQFVKTHLDVLKLFSEDPDAPLKPKHFATEQEARAWLDQKVDWSNTPRNIQEEISITYKGLDKEGKALIEFKVEANQLTNTLTYLEKVLSENDFARENYMKFSMLTAREKEALRYIVKGHSNQEIADKMFVSVNTIRTHRNRIWKKLGIKRYNDCVKFATFFD